MVAQAAAYLQTLDGLGELYGVMLQEGVWHPYGLLSRGGQIHTAWQERGCSQTEQEQGSCQSRRVIQSPYSIG